MIDVKSFKKCLQDLETTATENLVQECLDQGIPAEVILNEGLIGALEQGCVCGPTRGEPTTWGAIKSIYK